MAPGNEDRPPIIVQGGSLVIQSGDPKSSNPKHRKGKPWLKDGAHWKQKHDNGKDVKTYSVSFQGGGGSCGPTFATEVRVTYQLKSGDRVVILIGRADKSGPREREGTAGRLCQGTDRRQLKGSADAHAALEGQIVSISAGGNVCTNPVSAKLQPVK